jgi:hypothetical protein
MSKKFHVQERVFLNQKVDMRAYIIGIVEDTREIPNENDDDWKWAQIHLSMADCYRQISFDFDLSSEEERENSLFKIRKIAEIVNAVRDAIEIEARSIAERQAFVPLAKAADTIH